MPAAAASGEWISANSKFPKLKYLGSTWLIFSRPVVSPVVRDPTYAASIKILNGSSLWISNVHVFMKAGLLELELIQVAVPPLLSDGSVLGSVMFDAGN